MPSGGACTSCLRSLPDDARFCPFCGHEVVASATEERRVVTVLFADIVGYSSLSEHLDPERLKRLIDAAFQRLIVDIESFGGTIDKVLGDAILALFGAPIAHEDDADRAIRAAHAAAPQPGEVRRRPTGPRRPAAPADRHQHR